MFPAITTAKFCEGRTVAGIIRYNGRQELVFGVLHSYNGLFSHGGFVPAPDKSLSYCKTLILLTRRPIRWKSYSEGVKKIKRS